MSVKLRVTVGAGARRQEGAPGGGRPRGPHACWPPVTGTAAHCVGDKPTLPSLLPSSNWDAHLQAQALGQGGTGTGAGAVGAGAHYNKQGFVTISRDLSLQTPAWLGKVSRRPRALPMCPGCPSLLARVYHRAWPQEQEEGMPLRWLLRQGHAAGHATACERPALLSDRGPGEYGVAVIRQ